MNITRFAKAITYAVLTALLLVLSGCFQAAMHTQGGLEEGYFRSVTFLFVTAAALLGIGAYTLLSYTRRHKEHRGDSLLFLLIGLALMVLVVVLVLQFGGLEGEFDEAGHTAANVVIIALTVLPVPFWLRTLVLACTLRDGGKSRRAAMLAAAGLLLAAFVILSATGVTMRMVRYEGGETGSSAETDEENNDEFIL